MGWTRRGKSMNFSSRKLSHFSLFRWNGVHSWVHSSSVHSLERPPSRTTPPRALNYLCDKQFVFVICNWYKVCNSHILFYFINYLFNCFSSWMNLFRYFWLLLIKLVVTRNFYDYTQNHPDILLPLPFRFLYKYQTIIAFCGISYIFHLLHSEPT